MEQLQPQSLKRVVPQSQAKLQEQFMKRTELLQGNLDQLVMNMKAQTSFLLSSLVKSDTRKFLRFASVLDRPGWNIGRDRWDALKFIP